MPPASSPIYDLHTTLLDMQADGHTTIAGGTAPGGRQHLTVTRQIPGLIIEATKEVRSEGKLSNPDCIRVTLRPHSDAVRDRVTALFEGLPGGSFLTERRPLETLSVEQRNTAPSAVGYQIEFLHPSTPQRYTHTDETLTRELSPTLSRVVHFLQDLIEEPIDHPGSVPLKDAAK